MKTAIHPKYNTDASVKCACGNSFTTGSTIEAIETELCNQCHPFYTGKQKFVDSARRVEKFKAKMAAQSDVAKGRKGKAAKRAARAAKKAEEGPKAEEK